MIRKWFWRPLGAGLFILLPVGLAIIILVALFRFSDGILSPLIHTVIHFTGQLLNLPWLISLTIPGLGIVVLILLLYTAGILSLSRVGKRFVRLIEEMIGRLPLVGSMFQPDSAAKRVPVLAELQPGQNVVGFLTGETRVQKKGEEKTLLAVYIPTTPNLASGSLMFLPPDQITQLDMSVEEAMKLLVSGGLTVPPKIEGK